MADKCAGWQMRSDGTDSADLCLRYKCMLPGASSPCLRKMSHSISSVAFCLPRWLFWAVVGWRASGTGQGSTAALPAPASCPKSVICVSLGKAVCVFQSSARLIHSTKKVLVQVQGTKTGLGLHSGGGSGLRG